MKILFIAILAIDVLVFILYGAWKMPEKRDFFNVLNVLILALTLVALIWNTHITSRIATENEKANMRPVIFRNNILGDWDSVRATTDQTHPIVFTVFKNHATNIKGELIYNKVKYPLLLTVGSLNTNNKNQIVYDSTSNFVPTMGWAGPDIPLIAYPEWDKGIKVNESNQIKLQYKDVGGTTSYCLTEDQNFSQTINNCD